MGLVVAVAVLAACGSSGRELRDPDPGATPQTRTPDPTTSQSVAPGTSLAGITLPPSLPAQTMALSSPGWTPGEALPVDHACGTTTPPTLQWTEVPDETVELVLFASDLDAGEVLWFVTGIPPSATELDVSAMPSGAVAKPNDRGNAGWDGPCPTDRNHTVLFELVAMPRTVTEGFAGGSTAREALIPEAIAYGSLSAPVLPTGG